MMYRPYSCEFRWESDVDIWTYRAIPGGLAGVRSIEVGDTFLEFDRVDWWRPTRCLIGDGSDSVFGTAPNPDVGDLVWPATADSDVIVELGALARLAEFAHDVLPGLASDLGSSNAELLSDIVQIEFACLADRIAEKSDVLSQSGLVESTGLKALPHDRNPATVAAALLDRRVDGLPVKALVRLYDPDPAPSAVKVEGSLGTVEPLNEGNIEYRRGVDDLQLGTGRRLFVLAYYQRRLIGCASSTEDSFPIPTMFRLHPDRVEVHNADTLNRLRAANAFGRSFALVGAERSDQRLLEHVLDWWSARSSRRAAMAARAGMYATKDPVARAQYDLLAEIWGRPASAAPQSYIGLGGIAILSAGVMLGGSQLPEVRARHKTFA